MKFFTPELLERFASEDDRIALPAHDELEQRSAQYHKHLLAIAKKLPPRFMEMQERFYLHDARVLLPVPPFPPRLSTDFVWVDGLPREWRAIGPGFQQFAVEPSLPPSVVVVLRLDPPPQECLVLHYRFARMEFLGQFLPLEERLPFLEWQHDEIALVSFGRQTEFEHSILFTNGIEVVLRFRDFDYATLKPFAQPS